MAGLVEVDHCGWALQGGTQGQDCEPGSYRRRRPNAAFLNVNNHAAA